jgi:ribosomal protein L22
MNAIYRKFPSFVSNVASNVRMRVAPLNFLTIHTLSEGANRWRCSFSDRLYSLCLLSRTGISNLSTSATQHQVFSPASPATIFDEDSGKQLGVFFETRKLPKLKPSIVQRRLSQCKTYEGRELNIRQSPWKLNRICQLAAGLTLEEALTQLGFCPLKNADLVSKVLRRTSNLADIRDGIQISQLEVAECFVTKAPMLRRIKFMGRGRYGINTTHNTIVLRTNFVAGRLSNIFLISSLF